jgi:hypothetical protein
MPRIKTESEVATMDFLRKHTNFPVPTVYHYDSNPFNRLGGEYILMSKVTISSLPVALRDLKGCLFCVGNWDSSFKGLPLHVAQ